VRPILNVGISSLGTDPEGAAIERIVPLSLSHFSSSAAHWTPFGKSIFSSLGSCSIASRAGFGFLKFFEGFQFRYVFTSSDESGRRETGSGPGEQSAQWLFVGESPGAVNGLSLV